MADYDLGTAHGRIVVDYKDNGTGKAQKDLDGLRAKARQLLDQFQELTQKYAQGARKMASEGTSFLGRLSAAHRQLSDNTGQLIDDIDRLVNQFAALAGATALLLPALTRMGGGVNQLRGGISILSQLRGALGRVPSGAEGFPSTIKRIMQLSAAIGLFASASSLLAGATARFRGIGAVTGLLARFGGTVNNLAKPLHAVAGIAGAVAFQIVQFRFVKAIIKPLLMFAGALGAVGAVGGAVHVVAGLAVSIKDLAGAALLLPAILGAVGVAIATVKIGVLGLDEAFKNMDDPAKFAESLKNLAPSAREFAIAVREIYTKGFKQLRLNIQQKLFEGLGKVVEDVGGKYMPILNKTLGNVATTLNGVAYGVGRVLTSAEGMTNVNLAFDAFENIISHVAKAVPQLLRAFLGVMRIGAQAIEPLTEGLGDSAQRMADFVNSAEGAKKIRGWIDRGVQSFRDLWAIVKNVGMALGGIWRGINGGETKSLLATLADLTARFNEFVRSAEGQRILGLLGKAFDTLATKGEKLWDLFVTKILPVLEKWFPIAAGLSEAAVDGLTTAVEILAPIFEFLADVIEPLLPILKPILAAMITMAVVLMGLGVAAKILGGTLLILKSGLDTVRAAFKVAGFAVRLFTGNLKSGEKAALRFAGVLSKQLAKSALSLTGLGSAAGLVSGGGWGKGFIDGIRPFIRGAGLAGIGLEIVKWTDELTPKDMGNRWGQAGRDALSGLAGAIRGAEELLNVEHFMRPIQDAFDHIYRVGLGQSLIDAGDSIAKFHAGLPGKVTGAVQGVVDKVKGLLAGLGGEGWQPFVDGSRQKLNEFFNIDFAGFFTGLPERVKGWLSGLGPSASTSIGTAFQSMRTTAQQKFNELAGDAQGLPERIMHALGSLLGMFLQWATTTWGTLRTNVRTKWDEIVADTLALPGRIGAALTSLGQTLWQKAQEAWQRFKDSFTQKSQEAENDARQVPARIGNALTSLRDQLVQRAREAWDNFKREAQARIQTAIADAQALPGRIAAAISGLAGQLMAKAREAWNNFKSSALTTMNGAIADARALPGRIVAAIGNLGSTLYNSGVNLINGFRNGIEAAKQRVLASISSFMAGVRSYFPFSPAKKGPFAGSGYTTHSGKALVADFAKGMNANRNMIQSAALAAMRAANLTGSVNLGGVTGSVAAGSASSIPAWSGPVPGGDGAASISTNTFNVTLDAKSIAEMKDVADFFDKVQQKARAGKAGR